MGEVTYREEFEMFINDYDGSICYGPYDGDFVQLEDQEICELFNRVSAAVGAEQQRLRQVFLSIAEHHKLPAGAVLLFDVALAESAPQRRRGGE